MNTICEIRITGNRHVIDEKLASLKKKNKTGETIQTDTQQNLNKM